MAIETPAAHVEEEGLCGYVEYEIDVERILRADLPAIIQSIDASPLTIDAIRRIPQRAKGAYVLFERGHPVYGGKTDTRHGFRDRLERHANTILHRHNIDPAELSFKAIRILVFSNFDVEAILINELRQMDATALAWNDRGFGSNDPGHNREAQEPAAFDNERPVDIDRPLWIRSGTYGFLPLLIELKTKLPYYFRYQLDLNEKGRPCHFKVGHADFRSAPEIIIDHDNPTMRHLLWAAVKVLPTGWRATVFPNRVILYRESIDYPYAVEVIQR